LGGALGGTAYQLLFLVLIFNLLIVK
jgi:hypothetical protein